MKPCFLPRNGNSRQSREIRGISGEDFMTPQEALRAKNRAPWRAPKMKNQQS
jgi:hypothetical protein